MADKKEHSRADDLFDILNEFNDEPKKNSDSADVSPNGDRIDDILEILSAGSSKYATIEETSSNEDAEIPTAIFGHLSEESGVDNAPVGEPEENAHFTAHFSEDDGSVPPPVEEPETETEEPAPREKKNLWGVLGSIVRTLGIVPKAVVYIAIVIIAAAYLSYYIITIGNDVFALVTDNREVTITIEEGADNEIVAAILEENGVIQYGWVYEIYMDYRGSGDNDNEYIPGEYKLNTNYNYSQIITALTSKTVKREIVRITIPEGFTVDQIIDLLVSSGVGQRDDYIEAINNYPYKWEFVQRLEEMGYSEHRKYRLEGYLYPDTYDFYTTESEVYVINKMLNAFNDRFWKDFIRVNADGSSYQNLMLEKYGMNFDDIIVLASMVQSEGATVEDFYAISYVFHNRLSHPQSFPKLESDATIQYVLPERITDSTQIDISYDSPYNTYLYNGMPPGAISNAGLDALYATMFPTKPKNSEGDSINAYFFVSNNAGKTYYASTKNGHLSNVAQAKKDNEAIENGTYGND